MEYAMTAGRRRMGIGERLRQILTGLAGVAVTFGLASLLHFVYDWSGEMRFAAIFASVNESVWSM